MRPTSRSPSNRRAEAILTGNADVVRRIADELRGAQNGRIEGDELRALLAMVLIVAGLC
jgi:hypothetical protein